MSILGKLVATALGAAMMVTGDMMPPIAGRRTPTFERSVEYDGAGRKKKAPVHPFHNAKRQWFGWSEFARKVMATHRDLPDGTGQDDPRNDKYLHSHPRSMRGLRAALASAGR
jgi:hypothetical protein